MRDARIDTQGRYGNVGMRECGNAGMRECGNAVEGIEREAKRTCLQ